MKHVAVVVLFFAVIAPGVLNSQTVWKNDKAHSQVRFSVTHMLVSEVTGSFKDFDVTVTQPSDKDFSGGAVDAVIKSTSISTDNEMRDNHLRSDDFFNVEKYPEIRFKSTKFEKTGGDTYAITGDLTIRDITKPVVLDAKMLGTVEAFGGKHVGFKATTTVNRFDYNVNGTKHLIPAGSSWARMWTLHCFLSLPYRQKMHPHRSPGSDLRASGKLSAHPVSGNVPENRVRRLLIHWEGAL